MSQTYAVCEKCQKMNRVELMTNKEPVCGSCHSVLPMHGAVIEASDQSLPTLIDKSPLPVVVDVWAPWCGPCRSFTPTFEHASDQYAGKVVFAKLNSDENTLMASKFGIRGIPTILVFKNGKELTRQGGAIPREHFSHWLDQSIG